MSKTFWIQKAFHQRLSHPIPSRNLVARPKGNGSKRPWLILAHTDVVADQPEKWPLDPFGAVMNDGYIWGRGAIDDKDQSSFFP
jgi:acetylornithine deacetylase/succinyl-diaminopimelate desuccinylase-like protein